MRLDFYRSFGDARSQLRHSALDFRIPGASDVAWFGVEDDHEVQDQLALFLTQAG